MLPKNFFSISPSFYTLTLHQNPPSKTHYFFLLNPLNLSKKLQIPNLHFSLNVFLPNQQKKKRKKKRGKKKTQSSNFKKMLFDAFIHSHHPKQKLQRTHKQELTQKEK